MFFVILFLLQIQMNFYLILGRVTASLIGGMIMDAYGGRIAFRMMGIINFVTAVLYGIFCYFRRSFEYQSATIKPGRSIS